MPSALIVDDEPDANRLLSLLVQLQGYRTESTMSGTGALSILAAQVPDVVFLDLMLPDIDGYEVCRSIKSNPATVLVPVIIVSAALTQESRARSYQLGATVYVAKPYVAEQIFEALRIADAWKRELTQHGESGSIRLDSTNEDFAKDASRLKALLLARTPLGNQASGQVLSALEAIRGDALDFADRHAVEQVATVAYALRDDRLVLSIRDEAGGFLDREPCEPQSNLTPELSEVFDEAEKADSGKCAILTKLYASSS